MSLHGNTDANVSIPKYIDHGQIVAVTVTAAGSGYTTVPTVTIAAPNSGTQATATAVMRVAAAPAITSGGTGYAVGDVLLLTGGTGTKATLKVLTVTIGGVVATVSLLSPGAYTALPGSPSAVASTGGGAADATFNVTFKVGSITITNPGSGYVANDAAGVTFGSSGGATAAVVKHGSVFTNGQNVGQVLLFVSAEEAALTANKLKGLVSPGWWALRTYFDSAGTVRYKTELLVAMTVPNATSSDASDDAYAADTNVTVTISGQPSGQSVASPGTATFSVTASASSGTINYQWQKKVLGGRWTNISGAINATVALSSLVAADNGTIYRAVIGSSAGAAKVYTTSATLTYTATRITVQPAASVTTSGGNISLSVTAVAPGGTMAYAWAKKLSAGSTWSAVGTDSSSLSVAAANGDKIRVTVSNSNGDASVVSTESTVVFGS